MSRPFVYRYLGDKQELFGVVVDRVLREWNEVLVAEVFVSYTLLIHAGENSQVSARRLDATIETLLHGVIVPAASMPSVGA